MEWISVKENRRPKSYVPILCMAFSLDRRFRFIYEAIYLSPLELLHHLPRNKHLFSSQKVKEYSPFVPKLFGAHENYYLHIKGEIPNPLDIKHIFHGEVLYWCLLKNLPKGYDKLSVT